MVSVLLWILAALMVAIGIAGTVLPILPGPPLIFAGLVVAAWIDKFQRVGLWTLLALALITALCVVVDILASSLGARRAGASYLAMIGATVGAIVGLFMGLVGVLVGPFLGAMLGEYLYQRDLLQAGRAGLGTWLGLAFGAAAKAALIAVMLGVFALAFFI